MPVVIDRASSPSAARATQKRSIELGLINNMPDAALESTERQFLELIEAAATDIPVRLRLFALPDVPRGEAGRAHLRGSYRGLDELWESRLDALIVTGTEPRAPSLRDEPYWHSLAKILAWAQESTLSTVWSCLAAHAAVLEMDGINRHALDEKCFGVFECAQASDHPLLAGLPALIRVPHSRCNELREAALVQNGYTILTRSPEAGVDAFVKQQRKSLFVFFQGHPEYDERALLREYRRDIDRFLHGERDRYPVLPRGYFNAVAAQAAAGFGDRARSQRDESLIDSFPTTFLARRLRPTNRSVVSHLYRNWLSYVDARKDQPPTARAPVTTLRAAQIGARQAAEGIG